MKLHSAIALVVFALLLLAPPRASAGPLVNLVYTDKASYPPGGNVAVSVVLANSTGAGFTGAIQVAVFHLGRLVTNLPPQSVSGLAVAARATEVFSWLPPAIDYQGYQLWITATNSAGGVTDTGASAVDVSSDWARFPRYGYVAQYGSGLNASNTMWQLKNYHLNGIEFYDWQWKHHVPYNPGASWPDVANRTIYRATVVNLLNAAHGYNMVAMNYNLYGGAYADYATDGSGVQLAMGIFSDARPAGGYSPGDQYNDALPAGWATPALYEMNNRDTNWQNYIFGQEQLVFSNLPFDGWHIDSLGVHTANDFTGAGFSLDDANPGFINNAKAALGKRMTFNTVDAGGENQVAQSAGVEFVYSELWAGNADYLAFNQRVNNVRSFGSKALVLPAYLNTGLTSGTFNEASVRLADAAIFACGVDHLELGDGGMMLHDEYFPDDTSVVMTAALAAAMHDYRDFQAAYENLLRDSAVSAANPVSVTGAPADTQGTAGAVWVIAKKTLGDNVVHFVNLVNCPSSVWRDTNANYPAPSLLTNLAVKMYHTGALGGGGLWFATPDTNHGLAAPLAFTAGSDAGGNYVVFSLPRLQYWDMVWLEINGTDSAADQFKAANYDSMAGIGTETTADVGGGLDVADVNNLTGDSYVAFNNVDFLNGVGGVSARVASALAGGSVEFHLDAPAGLLIATVTVGDTGGWQTWQTKTALVSGAAGVHRVFAVFKGAASNLNWFQFNNPAANTPPVLAAISNRTLIAGATLVITNSAADADTPPPTLTYSLPGAPAGAAIDPNSGVFTWRPAIAQSPSTQTVAVAVTDNGAPPLGATQSFLVTVIRPAAPVLDTPAITNGHFAFLINGDAGPDYIIQSSTNLGSWNPVFTSNSPALPFLWADPASTAWSPRFYRVLLGP